MELTGDTTIAAPPEVVWAALIDPEFLKRLIPGCESMTGDPEHGYDITVVRKVGSLDVRMSGRFVMSEIDPARGCLLSGSGHGGGAGQARGTAQIDLSPEGEGTRLAWSIRAEVEGRLAAFPDFIVTMAARRIVDGFVERFAAAIEGRRPARANWLGRLTGR